MLELLGLLGGALARFAPLLLTFFKEGRDLKFELQRLDKEITLEEKRGQNATAEIAATSAAAVESSWAGALMEAMKNATPPVLADSGKWYINVLNAANISVRPVLTYWWCIVLYTGHKSVLLYIGLETKMPLVQMAPILLTDFDRAVVGSIIGFWFVDRSLRHGGAK